MQCKLFVINYILYFKYCHLLVDIKNKNNIKLFALYNFRLNSHSKLDTRLQILHTKKVANVWGINREILSL